MKISSKYLFLAAALIALAACNKDGTQPEGTSAPVEIRLTSSLEAQTRATHGLDTQIAANETVHVWVDDAGTSGSLYQDNTLTADGNGAFTGGDAMYFPSNGNTVNIYAIHGNFQSADGSDADLSASFWDTELTHAVAADQQTSVTDAGAGYAGSDLIYCVKTGVGPTGNAVNLTFKHLLSKVEVVLYQGAGNPGIATLEILNTALSATFTPVKSSNLSAAAADNSTGTIILDHETTAADAEAVTLNEAIIVPQTLSAGTQLFRITTDGGSELYYALPDETTFEAGKKYRYIITASLTELTVTTEISDWENDESSEVGGTANRGVAYKTNLSTAKVGDLLTDSGCLIDVDDVDNLLDSYKAKVVAVVFKVGHQASDTDYTDTGIGQSECHGYAVALKDAHEEAGAWGIRGTDIAGLTNESSTGNYNGYSNTQVVYALDEFASTDVSTPTAEGQYWAFRVVYEYSVAAPENSSGWYLPSIGQLCDIYDLWSANPTLFTSVDGTDFITDTYDGRYWSSTEISRYDAWYYQFNGSGAASYAKSDTTGESMWLRPSYVRAVLSF